MSMICCQGCDSYIDSDDDPDCFVGEYEPGVYSKDVLCEHCRDDETVEREREEAAASAHQDAAERAGALS